MLSMQTFKTWAHELGFEEIGFCSPERFFAAEQMVRAQAPIAERKQLRFFPKEDYPQTKSLAVLLWPYRPAQRRCSAENLFVDSYYSASNAAYHAAKELEAKILSAGRFAKANVSYPAKEAALRAGMGVIGRNSLLITSKYGTRVVIILMATDIEIPVFNHEISQNLSCIGCGQCVKSCPAGAIAQEGMIHPERCLRNFMMEGVAVPEHLRNKIGMRLIGCDICQHACPMQPSMPANVQDEYPLDDFVTADSALFSAAVTRLANEIGRNAARPQRVRAQAALLAGNSKNTAYLPVLHQWAQMSFSAVREHALWAIRQIEEEAAST